MKMRAIGVLGATALFAVAGFAGPAAAEKPADGTAGGGNAMMKAQPKGQKWTNPDADSNAGFRCDTNKGVGQGNPAFVGCGEGIPR